jgi:hypothetical protein
MAFTFFGYTFQYIQLTYRSRIAVPNPITEKQAFKELVCFG